MLTARGFPALVAILTTLLLGLIGFDACSADVVINEIYFHPPDKRPLEFVELYNSGSQSVSVAGWILHKYIFPSNCLIKSDGFLVVAADPVAFEKEFGFKPLGPLGGRLKYGGAEVRLHDSGGRIVDEVRYGVGFPWPTASGGGGSSLERVNPSMPGNAPGSWRSSGFPAAGSRQAIIPAPEQKDSRAVPNWQRPTPGETNSVFSAGPIPIIKEIQHIPVQPKSGETVTVSVRIGNAGIFRNWILRVQVVEPGKYIRYSDSSYQTNWLEFPMQSVGRAEEGHLEASVPGEIQKHRRLIRYRVVATGGGSTQAQSPDSDDEIANYAWFVYDGLPAWAGSSSPGRTPILNFSPETLGTLPVYHLLAREGDVARSQWNGGFNRHPFFGTLVYGEKVYDHIIFHNRGQASTYLAGKNKWAFRFHRGHPFAAKDNYGRLYENPWHGLELNACASPWVQMNRGMAGMDEALSFRSYQLAGVPAANTHWIHFRVIDRAEEAVPDNQYQGDLWGLYLAVQPMEGPWLDELGLPPGNVYSLESGRKYLARGMPADGSDWERFSQAIRNRQSEAWWRSNLNVPALCSFHALNRLLGNVDLREDANHGFYHAPDGHWAPIPWDNDMMFIPHSHQSGVIYPVRCLEIPGLQTQYRNRVREILDLFVSDRKPNGGQFAQLVDEFSRILLPPGQANSWPELDMAMWNHHPRSRTPGEFYVNPYTRGWSGEPFRRVLDTADFQGFCRYIVNFCSDSRQVKNYAPDDNDPVGHGWGYLSWEASDDKIPQRPIIRYVNTGDCSVTNLAFTISPFAAARAEGNNTRKFAAVQWRLAEIRAPGLAGYVPGKPFAYELTPTWQSQEVQSEVKAFCFPSNICAVGHTYRIRARYKDSDGRWSHWSEPIQTVPR